MDAPIPDMALLDHAAVRAMMDADALPNDGRVELIDGVLIEMSPAYDAHGGAMGALTVYLGSRLPTGYRILNDAALFLSKRRMFGADILVLPKGVISHEARGEDLSLVIEIANDSRAKDLGVKAAGYGTDGVPDYWVVDLPKRLLHIHRQPREEGYDDVKVLEWTEIATPLFAPGLEIRLAEIFEDIA